jgi:hypothetical protein
LRATSGKRLDRQLAVQGMIDQALSPVHDPGNSFTYLTPGVHPSVKKAASTPAKIAAAKETADKKLDAEKGKLQLQSVPETDETKKNETTKKIETIDDIKGKITPENLTEHPDVLDNLIKEHENDANKPLVKILKDLRTKVTAAKKPPPKPKQQINDPLDTISHQIQFIVTWNASATPSWTLVNVKGPAPAAGSFLSAQRQTTHQLLITMGRSNPTWQASGNFSNSTRRLSASPFQSFRNRENGKGSKSPQRPPTCRASSR